MKEQTIKSVLENPKATTLPMAPAPARPEWWGKSLGQVLQDAAPDEGLRLLEFLANGYSGELPVKLAAALLLGQHHGWGPYQAAPKATPRKTTPPKALTGTALRAALTIAAKVAPRKAALDVLTCILVQQTAERLTLTANSLELAVRVTLPYGGEPLALAVPQDIKKTVKGRDPVRLSSDAPNSLLVEIGSKQTRFVGQDAGEFPVPPDGKVAAEAPIDLAALAALACAASKDAARPMLTVVYIGPVGRCPECGAKDTTPDIACSHCDEKPQLLPGEYIATAADGFRLAWTAVDLPAGFPTVSVPAQAVALAGGVIAAEAKIAVLEGSDDAPVVALRGLGKRGEEVEVIAQSLPGRFPNIFQVIPTPENTPAQFVAPTKRLLDAVDSLRGLDGTLKLTLDGDQLHLVAEAPGSGRGEETVTLAEASTRSTMTALEVRYLYDALASAGAADVAGRVGLPYYDHSPRVLAWKQTSVPLVFDVGSIQWVVMPKALGHVRWDGWRPDEQSVLEHGLPVANRTLRLAAQLLGRGVATDEEERAGLAEMARRRSFDAEAALAGAGWLDAVRETVRGLVAVAAVDAGLPWTDEQVDQEVQRLLRTPNGLQSLATGTYHIEPDNR